MDSIRDWNDYLDNLEAEHQAAIAKRKPPLHRQLSLALWGEVLSAGIETHPALLGSEGSSEANESDH